MNTFRILESIAAKLELSAHEMLVVYAYSRIGVDRWGWVRSVHIVDKLIKTFGLIDSDFEKTYGKQLQEKGILSEVEALFFDSNEIPLDSRIALAGQGGNGDHPPAQMLAHDGLQDQRPTRKRKPKGKTKRSPVLRSQSSRLLSDRKPRPRNEQRELPALRTRNVGA
jgi:hypothetical protein